MSHFRARKSTSRDDLTRPDPITYIDFLSLEFCIVSISWGRARSNSVADFGPGGVGHLRQGYAKRTGFRLVEAFSP